MSAIASKNLYELLGNDLEHDPDRPADPPVKVVDKTAPRVGKRNATEAPAPRADPLRPSENARGGRDQGNRGGQRDDGLRADRHTQRTRGWSKHQDIIAGQALTFSIEPREYRGDGPRGGRGRGRGGRGGRGGPPRDDRHSHTGIGEHEKQAAAGWGAEANGQAEWNDEKAGDAIASAEAKNSAGFTPDTGAADPAFSNGPDRETGAEEVAPEPEDNTKSYDQYLAEQAEKRLALSGNTLEVRKANEGSKQKFPEGSAFSRKEEDFFAAAGGKTKREKEVKSKTFVPLEDRIYSAPDSEKAWRVQQPSFDQCICQGKDLDWLNAWSERCSRHHRMSPFVLNRAASDLALGSSRLSDYKHSDSGIKNFLQLQFDMSTPPWTSGGSSQICCCVGCVGRDRFSLNCYQLQPFALVFSPSTIFSPPYKKSSAQSCLESAFPSLSVSCLHESLLDIPFSLYPSPSKVTARHALRPQTF
nr:hypothetical protein CFP56_11364 [Quercus suber]